MINEEFKQIWSPWIGARYENRDLRLMLIGESHYSVDKNRNFDDDCYQNFLNSTNTTIDIIKRLETGENWRIFSNTYKALFGDNQFVISDFWSKVGFYNLIQRPMKLLSERPNQNDFKNYLKVAIKMIENLQIKPTHLIFLGNSSERYFNSLINESDQFVLLEDNEEKIGRYWAFHKVIKSNNNIINVFFIKHPSSYFSWKKWNSYLNDIEPNFLKLKDSN
ncbi:hypothetical protein [Flavobacterium sp. UMI-01]|uniref:hypothetical protein n=1 Tax=Flavobacterium sp. UMI-01 TaxID=1441053 RepID=UPI001C7D2E4B|nr:hypothetical protein [Flavobacterium sp. UMI-01]GIZ08037.1 hypothetical protein FUMI01_07640 [Flavobacterium sp. UMI-01]